MKHFRVDLIALLLAAALAGCSSSPPKRPQLTANQGQQADKAYASGDMVQAQSGYEALTRANPGNADAWFRLGNIYVRTARPDEAVDAYQHALRIEPKHAKASHNLGIVRLRQAQAALAQSALSAAGTNPALQRDSANLVQGIAALGSDATPDAAPAANASAALPATTTGVTVEEGTSP